MKRRKKNNNMSTTEIEVTMECTRLQKELTKVIYKRKRPKWTPVRLKGTLTHKFK